ncbi:MAG: Glycosyl transferase family 2 [Desulfonauticus sp. 38_4375]|nr:MAG: Glycosyl transferase family 2 [Desulfonauticus sp. 38_4375]
MSLLVSVILTNYNYAHFLDSAIESVLKQTYGNFELIVVDDGSSDNSREIINYYVSKDSRIIPILKKNEGQASALNIGFKKSKGEIISFLDSDDIYAPNKLEEIVKYHSLGYQYIYTDHQGIDVNENFIEDNLKRYLYSGWNIFPVYFLSKYVGNITSTISITRNIGKKIFPIPNEDQWKIQADDPIVFQASFVSSNFFLNKKLVFYRIHQSNNYYGKNLCNDYKYKLLIKRNNLKDIIMKKEGISSTFINNWWNLVAEFNTHEFVDLNLYKMYRNILWFNMNIPFLSKIKAHFELKKRFKLKYIKN